MQIPAGNLGDEEEGLADDGHIGVISGSDQIAGGDEKLRFFRREDERPDFEILPETSSFPTTKVRSMVREMQGTILVEKDRNLPMEKGAMEQPPKLGFLGTSSSSNNGERVTAPAFNIDEIQRLANKVVDEGDANFMAALAALKNRCEARGGLQGIPRVLIKARRGILIPAIEKIGEKDADLTGMTFSLQPATPEFQAGESVMKGCEYAIPTRGVEVSSSTYSPLKGVPLASNSIEETNHLPPSPTGDLGLLAGRMTSLEREIGQSTSSQHSIVVVFMTDAFPPAKKMNSQGKMVAGPSEDDVAPITEVAHTFRDVEGDVEVLSADDMAEDEMAQVMVGVHADISNSRVYVSSARADVSNEDIFLGKTSIFPPFEGIGGVGMAGVKRGDQYY
ncbi:UNVERIFIED_CONTAM: hypothetical protein Sindi_2028600 [Sesamum indicum]